MNEELLHTILQDPTLAPEHKGALLYMLCFGYDPERFAGVMDCGRDKRSRIVSELCELGYLERKRENKKGERGITWRHIVKYGKWEWNPKEGKPVCRTDGGE